MVVLVAAMGAIATFLFVLFGLIFIRRSRSMDIFHRLRRHYDANAGRFKQTEDILRRAHDFIDKAAKPIADLNISKNLDFILKQAGIPLLGAEFIVVALICAVLGTVALYVITFNLSIAPLAGIGIILIMLLWVRMRVNKRRKAFTEQLGDCLTTVANALRAGYSFQQAMDVVAREMEPPMSTEFERVTTDVAMGVTLEDALQQMNRRVGSRDFDLVVTAVLIQREIGGNLAQILDTISYTINERIRMKREINALTAQGRFSAWVLMVLPFVVAAFCWVFNHDQMLIFVNEDIGRIALAAIIIMQIFGFIVIRRIVDIEL